MSAEEAATTAAVNANEEGAVGAAQTGTGSAPTGLQQLRRIRRSRAQYEKLQRPEGIAPGQPIPSIEGWTVLLTNLPPPTTAEDVQDMFVSYKSEDPAYFGNIREVKIPLDKECCCLGYVLVELDSEEGFRRACAEMPGYPITFYTDGGGEPRRLGIAPAFVAEEDDPAEPEDEAASGEKRTRD